MTGGVRGKYANEYHKDAKSVNEALRALAKTIHQCQKIT